MNLSTVEYYFADFLSLLESNTQKFIRVYSDEIRDQPELFKYQQGTGLGMELPNNVWFIRHRQPG